VPTRELLLRIDDAIWSGTNPTPSATFMMRASVAGASLPGLRNARETVIGESPAALAMVRTLWGESAGRLRFFLAAIGVDSRWNRVRMRMCLVEASANRRVPGARDHLLQPENPA